MAMLNPAKDMKSFTSKELKITNNEIPDGLGVATEYFMAHIRLSFGRADYRIATLYQRKKNKASIIWQAREFY